MRMVGRILCSRVSDALLLSTTFTLLSWLPVVNHAASARGRVVLHWRGPIGEDAHMAKKPTVETKQQVKTGTKVSLRVFVGVAAGVVSLAAVVAGIITGITSR